MIVIIQFPFPKYDFQAFSTFPFPSPGGFAVGESVVGTGTSRASTSDPSNPPEFGVGICCR
jgi:hypothetical protein